MNALISSYSLFFLNAFFTRFTFFYLLLALLLKNYEFSAMLMAISLAMHEILKAVVEPLTGRLADKKGNILVNQIGVFINLLAYCTWYFATNQWHIVAGFAILGVGKACKYSKLDPFIYNSLVNGKRNFFYLDSVQYIFINFAVVLVGLIASFNIGTKNLLLIGFLTELIIHLPVLIMLKKYEKVFVSPVKAASIFNIFGKDFKEVLKKHSYAGEVVVIATLESMYILFANCYKIIFIKYFGYSKESLSTVYSWQHFLCICVVVLFLIVKKRLPFKLSKAITAFVLISVTFCSIYLKQFAIMIPLVFGVFYPLLRASAVQKLNQSTKDEERSFVESVANSISSLFNVCIFSLGFIFQADGYNLLILGTLILITINFAYSVKNK